MNRSATPWLFASAPLALFGALAWKLPSLLGLGGWWGRSTTLALLLLGVAVALLTFFLLRARARRAPQVEGGAEIDETMAAARTRLAQARTGAEARLARLPLVLVLGPLGSTKTSVVLHSGLDPELLAGDATRAGTVVATDPLNVWYAHNTVLVEAGGRLLEDAARWRRLLTHLAPRRLGAALGRGRQAPRTALLCIPCDGFTRAGASQELEALARQLRARLGEAAAQLGVRLPVYVLFTRADRLPFFPEYVRNLTAEEAEQVLGATLPLSAEAGPAWAEHESQRLNDAFAQIVRALALRRLALLPREAQASLRAGGYEFPRELRKLVEPAVQLLVDVFRPSQLGASPVLRGFYFTGVRPVILGDAAPAPPLAAPAAPPVADAATSVFNAAALRQAAQGAAPVSAGGRKVPQWLFLRRLFRDVLPRDEVALALTAGGQRVDLLRRTLLTAAVLAGVLFMGAASASYVGNRSLIRNAKEVALHAQPARTGERSDLLRLDSLRTVTAATADIDRRLHPRYHWGLYRGDQVYAHLRSLYFERFRTALWQETRERILRHLETLPEEPGAGGDFGGTQRAFLAYRLTADRTEHSTAEDLAPALIAHWTPLEGAADTALAERQFAFFGAELPRGVIYPDDASDPQLVARAQRYLLGFGGDVYYDALISSLNVAPSERYEGSEHVLDPKVVPGAFTLRGLRSFESNPDVLGAILSRYGWLYDGRTPSDRPDTEQLSEQYYDAYVQHWQDYLARARVEPFGSWDAAAARFQALGATRSPLFELLRIASQHTGLREEHPVTRAFQPLHALVAPGENEALVTNQVTAYVEALAKLAAQARTAAGALEPPVISGDELRTAVSTLVSTRADDPAAAQTAVLLRALLNQPADYLDRLGRSAPREALNRAGADFCREYRGLEGRLPFSAGASASASASDVTRVFASGGLLSALYDGHLRDFITERGDRQPGREALAPSFVAFYRAAVLFREALYPGGASMPLELHFSFEPPPGTSVRLEIDGIRETWSAAVRAERRILWQPERSQSARLLLVTDAGDVMVAQGTGAYALFRLFHAAGSRWSGSGPYEVEWSAQGRPIVGSISMSPQLRRVLQRGSLDPLRQCVSTIIN